ncbi:MAG: FG-GAP repeat protein [Planctomycetes bacterium]|nr:FG-GAP repeat protein [Planctomycetota bacterium]
MRFLPLALAALLLAGALRAQSPLASINGPANSTLGSAVGSIADLNGDGVREVVVGMPSMSTASGGFSGQVRVYSGAYLLHGTQPDILFQWNGALGAAVGLGNALAAGVDVDGDGVQDVLAGATGDDQGGLAPDSGSVNVFSGASGALLATFYSTPHKGLGISVAFVGDVNGDGYEDVGGGQNPFTVGPTAPGNAFVWSGEWIARTAAGQTPLSPMLLWSRAGHANGDRFGRALCAFGDLDFDGHADFAVGARQGGANAGGYVEFYSGATGNALFSIDGPLASSFFGTALATAGDVDGDGWDDLAIGAPGFDPPGTPINTNVGAVYVLSGEWASATARGLVPQTPQFVLTVQGPNAGDGLGQSIASLGDLDFDGRAELALGGPQYSSGPVSGPGFVELVSGASGQVLWRSYGAVLGDSYGQALAAAGDLDGDGVPDLVVGAPQIAVSGNLEGRLRVLSGFDLVGTTFCSAVPDSSGLPAAIGGHGTSSVSANGLLLSTENVPPHATGVFLIGSGTTPLPAGNGVLCIGGAAVHRLGVVSADASGRLVLPLDLLHLPPSVPAILPGADWNFEAWFRDTPAGGAGFNFSNALDVHFRP